MKPVKLDRNYPILPLDKSIVQKPTIDARLREALKPVVSDISVLRPDQFKHLCKDTHIALTNRLNTNEDTEETRSALSDLIRLLEENMALQSTFEEYVNRVKKV
jgi:hypothetical protein